jgi:hypothetical protein
MDFAGHESGADILIDSVAQRVVDFVTLTNVSTELTGQELIGN